MLQSVSFQASKSNYRRQKNILKYTMGCNHQNPYNEKHYRTITEVSSTKKLKEVDKHEK